MKKAIATCIHRALGVLLVAGVASVVAGAVSAEPVLVAHPGVGVDSLAANDVRRVFLGSSSRIEGTSVVLAVQKDGDTHAAFLREVLSKSPQQFTSHWRKIVFSGKGKMPEAFAGDRAVVEFVEATPGAIGYVDSAAASGKVKRITID